MVLSMCRHNKPSDATKTKNHALNDKSCLDRVRQLIIVACLLLGMMTCIAPLPALATEDADQQSANLNVGLVIDGSGSLVDYTLRDGTVVRGTDPNGLRYDAISLFLALLSDKGNYIDAVVFDDSPAPGFLLNTGLQAVDGRDAKVAMAEQIQNVGTGGDTDIGTALLNVVDTLASADNGLDSVVILFSDGRTDLGNDADAYNTSIANKESAIARAQEAGIPVYTICLNATEVADPDELQDIATRTSGDFVAVSSADGLESAFESFYNLIFSTSSSERSDMSYNEDGLINCGFDVPSYGAKEINIIVSNVDISQIELQSPSQTYSTADIEASSMSAGVYRVIKLVDPSPGSWELVLHGVAGQTATINIVYNVDVSAHITTSDGQTEFDEGSAAEIQVALWRNGAVVSDPAITQDYRADLTITNLSSGEASTYTMDAASNGMFTYSFGSDEISSYSAYATLTSGDVVLTTDSLELSFSNTAPYTTNGDDLTRSVTVTPFSGKSDSLNLADYFDDAQDGTNLSYAIASSQLVKDTVALDGSTLAIDTSRSTSGEVVIVATDSQGATTQLALHMKVHDLRPIFLTIVIGVVVVLAIAIALVIYKKTHIRFRGLVTVRNADTANYSAGPAATRPIRGKVLLEKFMVMGNCGFNDKKAAVVAKSSSSVVFTSKDVPIYTRASKDAVSITNLNNGKNVVYADKDHSKGLIIEVEPDKRRSRSSASRSSAPRGSAEPRRGAQRSGRKDPGGRQRP